MPIFRCKCVKVVARRATVAQIWWKGRRGAGKPAADAAMRSRQYLAAFEGEERVEFGLDRECSVVFSGRIIAVAAISMPCGAAMGIDNMKGSRL